MEKAVPQKSYLIFLLSCIIIILQACGQASGTSCKISRWGPCFLDDVPVPEKPEHTILYNNFIKTSGNAEYFPAKQSGILYWDS